MTTSGKTKRAMRLVALCKKASEAFRLADLADEEFRAAYVATYDILSDEEQNYVDDEIANQGFQPL